MGASSPDTAVLYVLYPTLVNVALVCAADVNIQALPFLTLSSPSPAPSPHIFDRHGGCGRAACYVGGTAHAGVVDRVVKIASGAGRVWGRTFPLVC